MCDVVGDDEGAVCACAFRVDDSFRDSFSIEFGEFVNEVVVLYEEGAVLAGGEGVLVVVDGDSHGGGHYIAGHSEDMEN